MEPICVPCTLMNAMTAPWGPGTATDANCPVVSDPSPSSFVTLKDTFDWERWQSSASAWHHHLLDRLHPRGSHAQ